MIDHRGIVLPLPPFFPRVRRVSGKGLKVGQGGEGTPYLLFVLREKIIALLRGGESRVLLSLLVGFGRSKTRKHLASRITFLELGFCDLRGTDTCHRNPRGG